MSASSWRGWRGWVLAVATLLGCKAQESNFEAFDLEPPSADEPAVRELIVEPLHDCGGACPGWSRVVFGWHDAAIAAAVASATADRVASLSLDGTLRIWTAHTAEPIAVLQADPGERPSMVTAADGTVFAARLGREVAIIDWHTAERRATIRPETAPTAMVLDSDSTVLVSTQDGTLRRFDFDGRATETIDLGSEGTRRVSAMAVSTDGKHLVLAGSQEELGWEGLLALDGSAPLRTFRPAQGSIMPPASSVAVSSDGSLVATGGYELRVWDPGSGELQAFFRPPGQPGEGAVHQVAFATDDRAVELVLRHSTLARFDLEDRQLRKIPTPLPFVTTAGFPADAPWAVIGGGSGRVVVVDRYSGHEVAAAPTLGAGGLSLAFTNEPARLVAGMTDGTLRVFDPEGARQIQRIRGHDKDVNALALAEDGRLFSGGHDGKLLVHDLENPGAAKKLRQGGAPVLALALCGDALWAALADGFVERYAVGSGNQLQRVRAHDKEVTGLAVDPDCTKWVTSSEDGTLRSWSSQAAKPTDTWKLDGPRSFQDVAYTDGAWLSVEAFLGGDQLRRWSEEGTIMHALAPLKLGAIAVQALPDGRLVTADLDGAATLRSADGEVLARFPSTGGHVMGARMSADGRWIALGTTGNEATVRLWQRRDENSGS